MSSDVPLYTSTLNVSLLPVRRVTPSLFFPEESLDVESVGDPTVDLRTFLLTADRKLLGWCRSRTETSSFNSGSLGPAGTVRVLLGCHDKRQLSQRVGKGGRTVEETRGPESDWVDGLTGRNPTGQSGVDRSPEFPSPGVLW